MKQNQTSIKRFIPMARVYDKMAAKLVPKYDFLQDEMVEQIATGRSGPACVVDLGAGSGILLEKIFRTYPNCFGYWVDASEGFLEIARKRLEPFQNRVSFNLSTLEDPWESQLEKSPDAIVSMSAIHHLESHDKRRLYRRCFECLQPGGRFINTDEMKTVYDESYLASMRFWVDSVERYGKNLGEAEAAHYAQWKDHFDKWKTRNVDGVDRPKSRGDDLHESFLDQIAWLKEIGFINPDILVKYHLWSMITGQKPLGG